MSAWSENEGPRSLWQFFRLCSARSLNLSSQKWGSSSYAVVSLTTDFVMRQMATVKHCKTNVLICITLAWNWVVHCWSHGLVCLIHQNHIHLFFQVLFLASNINNIVGRLSLKWVWMWHILEKQQKELYHHIPAKSVQIEPWNSLFSVFEWASEYICSLCSSIQNYNLFKWLETVSIFWSNQTPVTHMESEGTI